jgi:hypothetical protein
MTAFKVFGNFLVGTRPRNLCLGWIVDSVRREFPVLIENLGNSELFHASFALINRKLAQITDVLKLITAVDREKTERQKFEQFLTGLSHISEMISEKDPARTVGLNLVLAALDKIVDKVAKAPMFQLRLGVTLPELVDFLVCAHNMLFVSHEEMETGLTFVFSSISPAFPRAAELRDDISKLVQWNADRR